MAYSREIYEKAQQIIDKRRSDAENRLAAKIRLFETMEPDYRLYKNEMINSVKEAVKAVNMSPEKAAEYVEKQKEINLAAQKKVLELIRKNNLPDNYLEAEYFCPKCEDTGFYESKLCSCHIDLIKSLAYDEEGKKSPLKFSLFEDFKLDYYSNTYSQVIKCSPREKMSRIFDFCKEYADSFDTDSPSLFMHGETGLGKTHLSLAIAGTVIKKGFSVMYNSAQNIFNELQKERFSRTNTDGTFEAMVLECDLLVIDDLGAEFITQFTTSALYNIINTRMNSMLPTIISTNLSLSEIESTYSKRISSRIIGEYSVISFAGNDIRQIKSEE